MSRTVQISARFVAFLLGLAALLGIGVILTSPASVSIYVVGLLPALFIVALILHARRSRALSWHDIILILPGAIFFLGLIGPLIYLNPLRTTAELRRFRQSVLRSRQLMIVGTDSQRPSLVETRGDPLLAITDQRTRQMLNAEIQKVETADRLGLPRAAESYWEAGLLSFSARDYVAATRLLSAAATTRKRNASITNDLGVAYFFTGQKDLALARFQEALQEVDKLNATYETRTAEAVAYNNLGVALRDKGQLGKALNALDSALRASSDQQLLLTTKLNISTIYRIEAKLQEASDLADEVLRSSVASRFQRATAFQVMGLIAEDRGDFDAALESYSNAAKLYEETGNLDKLAVSYNDIADVYVNRPKQTDPNKALEYYGLALVANEKLGLHIEIALNRANMAYAYMQIGELEKALDYAQQALTVYRKEEHPLEEAAVLDTLGMIYLKKKEPKLAISYFEAALDTARRTGHRLGQAETLIHLASALTGQGQYMKARPLFLEAAAIFEQAGAHDKATVAWKLYRGEAKTH